MNSLQGIIPISTQVWKGARIIRVDALPATLPSGLSGDILACCKLENTSLELCMSTAGGIPGEVVVLIILRATSGYPYEALDRLERVSSMVLTRLVNANIRCHTVSTGASEVCWLNRFFSGDLAHVSTVAGFFPAEAEKNPKEVYFPGRYGIQGSKPVALGELVTLLSSHENAMISLTLNVTRIYPYELEVVKENRIWFACQADEPVIREGLETFSCLDQASNELLFLTCLTCFGSEACVRDVYSQLLPCFLHSCRLPKINATDGSYEVRGNEWVSAACIQYGHDPHTPRNMLNRMARLTYLAPLDVIASVFSLPQFSEDIKGIRINRIPVSKEPLPATLTRQDGIYVGQHCDSGLPIYIQPRDLTRHGFFVGKPGSGKTTFALDLLYRLYNHPNHYPFLAFEPAKTEYRSLMDAIPELQVYTPGRDDVAPIQLNPFLPPKGVRLEQYQQDLEGIFGMAFSVDHPLDVIFPQVISRCYAHYGWRQNSTRDSVGVQVFGLHEFIREFRRYIHEYYSEDPETLHNLENGGVVRLTALMKSSMFDTNQSLDVDKLLTKPTVIELDALNNTSQKALVMGIILTYIMETVQQRHSAGGRLKNVILIDEAHLLLGQNEDMEGARPGQAVVQMLQNMTLILRDYGTALLFGDQSPARLTSVIMDNVEFKMMFRLDSRQDRAILSDTTGMDRAMSDAMASLPVGEGYMACRELTQPIHIATPNADKELGLNRAQPDERIRRQMNVSLRSPFSQCGNCSRCGGRCDPEVRADGQFLANQLVNRPEIVECLAKPNRQHELAAFMGEPIVHALDETLEAFQIPPGDARLMDCARAQFIRALLIHPRFTLSEKELLDPDTMPRAEGESGWKEDSVTRFRKTVTRDTILEMCVATDDGSGDDGDEKTRRS